MASIGFIIRDRTSKDKGCSATELSNRIPVDLVVDSDCAAPFVEAEVTEAVFEKEVCVDFEGRIAEGTDVDYVEEEPTAMLEGGEVSGTCHSDLVHER